MSAAVGPGRGLCAHRHSLAARRCHLVVPATTRCRAGWGCWSPRSAGPPLLWFPAVWCRWCQPRSHEAVSDHVANHHDERLKSPDKPIPDGISSSKRLATCRTLLSTRSPTKRRLACVSSCARARARSDRHVLVRLAPKRVGVRGRLAELHLLACCSGSRGDGAALDALLAGVRAARRSRRGRRGGGRRGGGWSR